MAVEIGDDLALLTTQFVLPKGQDDRPSPLMPDQLHLGFFRRTPKWAKASVRFHRLPIFCGMADRLPWPALSLSLTAPRVGRLASPR